MNDEFRWIAAYKAWTEGDPAPVAGLLRDEGFALPVDMRAFLADMTEGKLNRPTGRPDEYPAWVKRSIMCEVLTLRDEGRNLADAIAGAAEARGSTEGQVRGIYQELRKAGITLEAWRRWGRPRWGKT